MLSNLDDDLTKMVMPKLSDLTPAQVRNLELYGWCRVCGSPREVHRETRQEDTRTQTFVALVCPNGHSQSLDF